MSYCIISARKESNELYKVVMNIPSDKNIFCPLSYLDSRKQDNFLTSLKSARLYLKSFKENKIKGYENDSLLHSNLKIKKVNYIEDIKKLL